MIKKLTLSLLLVTLGLSNVNVFASNETGWKHFFWGTNTRKAATVGGGIATLVGAFLLYKKFSAKPVSTPTIDAQNDRTEDVIIVDEKPAEVVVVEKPAMVEALPAGITPADVAIDAVARQQLAAKKSRPVLTSRPTFKARPAFTARPGHARG